MENKPYVYIVWDHFHRANHARHTHFNTASHDRIPGSHRHRGHRRPGHLHVSLPAQPFKTPTYTYYPRTNPSFPSLDSTTSGGAPASTCSSGSGGNSDFNGPSVNMVGGTIGGTLGALSTAMAALAAWFYKKKNEAETALAKITNLVPTPVKKEAPKEEEEEKSTPAPSTQKEEPVLYTTANEGMWVERPITGTPGIAGHGSVYT